MTRRESRFLLLLALCAGWPETPALAQTPPQIQRSNRSTSIAPAPVAPETISRAPDGAVTVRAFRLPGEMHFDGQLDEVFYREVPPMNGFIQQDPVEGAPATEDTDIWVFFDNDTLYVSARCWDSHPELQIVNEMRRDSQGIIQNESLTVLFDTFDDKRNGVFFQTNPLGAQRDAAITDESSQNQDWNTVWDVKTQRGERYWSVEMAIPFKSLRYDSDAVQVWGFNVRRTIRYKNEWTYLTAMPAALQQRAIWLVSLGATLTGVETPSRGLNLEVKPYAIADLRTDLKASPAFSNRGHNDFGGDAKYGLTQGLMLDLTYNTDFAQVEDDTQQVNLTRFNQFYPERRDFFLEGVGIFAFAGAGAGQGGGSGSNNTPIVFFSRRIGLNNGRAVPIAGGARVAGRVGDYSLGLLNIQSREDPASTSRATNFSVVRLKRDILKRSTVGMIYTQRTETQKDGLPTGRSYGFDGRYSVSTTLNFDGYFARTDNGPSTPLGTGDAGAGNVSYLARMDYNADRYGAQLEQLVVGEHFNPEVGFLRRSDFQRQYVMGRFSPRPAKGRLPAVRRFIYTGSLEYIENNADRVDYREQEGQFEIEFLNSDRFSLDYTNTYEYIPRPFTISSDVVVPVGGYDYQNFIVSYSMGTQHTVSGNVSYQEGSLYDGTKRALGLGSGRIEITPQLAVEPSISYNWVDLPYGQFTTTVVTERTTYTLTPRMFVSALMQYSSSSRAFSTNARFRWEYQAGSELFVVYSDVRDTVPVGFPPVINRAFIVKINKLFRL